MTVLKTKSKDLDDVINERALFGSTKPLFKNTSVWIPFLTSIISYIDIDFTVFDKLKRKKENLSLLDNLHSISFVFELYVTYFRFGYPLTPY